MAQVKTATDIRYEYDHRAAEISDLRIEVKNIDSLIRVKEKELERYNTEQKQHENNASKKDRSFEDIEHESNFAGQWEKWRLDEQRKLKDLCDTRDRIKDYLTEIEDINKDLYNVWRKMIERENARKHPIRARLMSIWMALPIYKIFDAIRTWSENNALSYDTTVRDLVRIDRENRIATVQEQQVSEEMQDKVAGILDPELGRDEKEPTNAQKAMDIASECVKTGQAAFIEAGDKETGETRQYVFSYWSKFNMLFVKDPESNKVLAKLDVADKDHPVSKGENIKVVKIGDITFHGSKKDWADMSAITKNKDLMLGAYKEVQTYYDKITAETQAEDKDNPIQDILADSTSQDTKDSVNAILTQENEPLKKGGGEKGETEPAEDHTEDENRRDAEHDRKATGNEEHGDEQIKDNDRDNVKSKENEISEEQTAGKGRSGNEERAEGQSSQAKPKTQKKNKSKGKFKSQSAEERAATWGKHHSGARTPIEEHIAPKPEFGMAKIELYGQEPIEIYYDNKYKADVLKTITESLPEAMATQSITDREGKYRLDIRSLENGSSDRIFEAAAGLSPSVRDRTREVIQKAAPDIQMRGRNFETAEEICYVALAKCAEAFSEAKDKDAQEEIKKAAKKITDLYDKANKKDLKTGEIKDSRSEFLKNLTELETDGRFEGIAKDIMRTVAEEEKDYNKSKLLQITSSRRGIDNRNIESVTTYAARIIEGNTIADGVKGINYAFPETADNIRTICTDGKMLLHEDIIKIGADSRGILHCNGIPLVHPSEDGGQNKYWTKDEINDLKYMKEELGLGDVKNRQEQTHVNDEPDLYRISRAEDVKVIDQGNINGYDYAIVNHGGLVNAYVSPPEGSVANYFAPEDLNREVNVHGGITYKNDLAPGGTMLPDGNWIGWNYNHDGDYNTVISEPEKKWTYSEVIDEVKGCIESFQNLDRQYSKGQDEYKDYYSDSNEVYQDDYSYYAY